MKRFIFLLFCIPTVQDSKILGGVLAKQADWPEVVNISNGCTATVIGPKVLLTAAHCAKNPKTSFTLNGVKHSVELTQSPHYKESDHDISLGIITPEVKEPVPVSLGLKLFEGQGIKLLGYGSNKPGFLGIGYGSGGGVLREGNTKVISLQTLYTTLKGTANIFYGDSGGPAYDLESLSRGEKRVVAVHSKTSGGKTTYDVRLDTKESIEFGVAFAKEHDVEICGLTSLCE